MTSTFVRSLLVAGAVAGALSLAACGQKPAATADSNTSDAMAAANSTSNTADTTNAASNTADTSNAASNSAGQ